MLNSNLKSDGVRGGDQTVQIDSDGVTRVAVQNRSDVTVAVDC